VDKIRNSRKKDEDKEEVVPVGKRKCVLAGAPLDDASAKKQNGYAVPNGTMMDSEPPPPYSATQQQVVSRRGGGGG